MTSVGMYSAGKRRSSSLSGVKVMATEVAVIMVVWSVAVRETRDPETINKGKEGERMSCGGI